MHAGTRSIQEFCTYLLMVGHHSKPLASFSSPMGSKKHVMHAFHTHVIIGTRYHKKMVNVICFNIHQDACLPSIKGHICLWTCSTILHS